MVNGVETAYDQNQSFEVVTIDNRTFPSSDRKGDLAFDMKAGQLYKAISGARKYLNELDNRIKHIKVAVNETLALSPKTTELAHQMQRDLAEIKLLLNGNSVIAKRAEPTATSVYGYISYLMWSRSESTSPINGQQKP